MIKTHARRMPASFFGMVLGLAGLGNGWRVAAEIGAAPAWVGEATLLGAGAVWLLLVVLYLGKWVWARGAALEEARHPIMGCYVGLTFVTTLLIAVAVLPYSRAVALLLAGVGGIGQVVFSASITGGLWRAGREGVMTTAVLYLPTVGGNFVAAMAAGALGYADIGVLFFGAGLLSWLAIESVLMHQLYTGGPLPAPLRPILGIQLAPPVVCCVAYLAVNGGHPDLFAQMLFGYGLFQAAVMIRLIPWFREQPFVPGYWAFSFGVVAMPLSALRMVQHGLSGPVAGLALPLFAVANLIIGYFAVSTVRLLVTGRLLPPAAAPIPASTS